MHDYNIITDQAKCMGHSDEEPGNLGVCPLRTTCRRYLAPAGERQAWMIWWYLYNAERCDYYIAAEGSPPTVDNP